MENSEMNNSNNEERLFSFYMHEAAARPLNFLEAVKTKTNPSYWEEFWAYYAATRMGDEDFTRQMYMKYIAEEEEGNDFYILLGYEAFLDHVNQVDDEECIPIGYHLLMQAKKRISPLLKEAFDAVHSLLPVKGDTLPVTENFYTQQLFVPERYLSIDAVREGIDKTKTKEEWWREINFLTDRLEFFYVESMLNIPDGWEGMTFVAMTPFTLNERGKRFNCYGMWKKEKYDYALCLDNNQKHPETMPLQQLKNMASYQKIALLLLNAIEGAKEGPIGWS